MDELRPDPPDRLLDACTALDLSGPLGWLAGRMLADLGADVIKVESLAADLDGADWRAFNVNKRLLRLDTRSRDGRAALERIIAGVDVLIETAGPGDPVDAWLRPERLGDLNPGLIHVSITPFGRTGPRAAWRGSDLEIMAAGGAMSLAGDPDGAPLRISVPQACSWAGAHAAVGALTALHHRRAGGGGQHVDVSAQAAVVVALAHAPTFVDLLGEGPSRSGSYVTGRSVHGAVYRAFWPCRDGYVNYVIYGGPAGRRSNKAMVDWLREKGLDPGYLAEVDWDQFDPKLGTQEEVDRIEAPLLAFFECLTKGEFLEGACAREMLGYPVSTAADIAADPQLAARRFWEDFRTPEGGRERHCGAFHVTDGRRATSRCRSFGRGESSAEILSEFGFSDDQIAALTIERRKRSA